METEDIFLSKVAFLQKRQNTNSIIFCILIVFIAICIFSLFFITVDVNVQSRGVITTTNRQSDAISAMYGKVFRPTMLVGYGDTFAVSNP